MGINTQIKNAESTIIDAINKSNLPYAAVKLIIDRLSVQLEILTEQAVAAETTTEQGKKEEEEDPN